MIIKYVSFLSGIDVGIINYFKENIVIPHQYNIVNFVLNCQYKIIISWTVNAPYIKSNFIMLWNKLNGEKITKAMGHHMVFLK